MKSFLKLFDVAKPIIGMVHLRALPGTPDSRLSVKEIVNLAVKEALIYREAGIHGLLVENMHDLPYLCRKVGPEVVAAMTLAAAEVKRQTGLPCGVQVLAGANREALAIALAAELDFIRAEGFVFSQVSDEGLMHSDAGELLRYRLQIGAKHLFVLTDIKKKHSAHAITADVDIAGMAAAADFFKSDGLILTGVSTGLSANEEDLLAVRRATDIPLLVGSGLTAENIGLYLPLADAFIVGSFFKQGGRWAGELDARRVEALLRAREAHLV